MIIKYIKITLLFLSVCILGFSIKLAINNYEIRYYIKQTFTAQKFSPDEINKKKVAELHNYFYGKTIPLQNEPYAIKDIISTLRDGFAYFRRIELKDKRINYGIIVFDKENNIRRYFNLESSDSTNSNFIISIDTK